MSTNVASEPISRKPTNGPTPGPFFFEPIPADAYTDPDLGIGKASLFWIVDSRNAGEVLALVEQTAAGEAQANARLFAASWELLKWLKELRAMPYLDEDGGRIPFEEFWPDGAERIDALLAKVEGR